MFHIILVEPEIPPNTGNVIRLCANTGAHLHLVRPLGFSLAAREVRRAGLDYHALASVQVHDDLPECLAALGGARRFLVETGASRRYCDVQFIPGDALFFGSETRGASEAVRAAIGEERCISIPMANATRSINLSNCVALVLYEAWRQLDFAGDSSGA